MLVKARTYSREISMALMMLLLTLITINVSIMIPTNKNTLVGQDNVNKETAIPEVYNTDAKVNVGITEMIHDIEIEPIIHTEESIEIEETIDLSKMYDFEQVGYINVNTELNVRKEASKSSEILCTLNWMDEVNYSIANDEWACVKLNNDEYGFIASKYITDNKESYTTTYSVAGDKSKTYMDYRTITDRRSNQYKLQMRASTLEENGLRILRDRYMVAVGSYFGCSVGQYIDVVLADGEVLECIVGDVKQDIHTDSQNLHGLNGDTVEFIVNEDVLKDKTDVVGNISDVSETFDGKVVEIRKYDHIEH